MRNIVNADFRAHSSPLFKKLDLLKVTDIYCFQTALFMFKFSQFHLPCKFYDYFSHISSVHQYTTRNSALAVMLPFCCTTIRQKCIRYQGPLIWNNLPSDIKLVDCSAAFKNLYKQYLINKYYAFSIMYVVFFMLMLLLIHVL